MLKVIQRTMPTDIGKISNDKNTCLVEYSMTKSIFNKKQTLVLLRKLRNRHIEEPRDHMVTENKSGKTFVAMQAAFETNQ